MGLMLQLHLTHNQEKVFVVFIETDEFCRLMFFGLSDDQEIREISAVFILSDCFADG